MCEKLSPPIVDYPIEQLSAFTAARLMEDYRCLGNLPADELLPVPRT
jgi:hypothetical protein